MCRTARPISNCRLSHHRSTQPVARIRPRPACAPFQELGKTDRLTRPSHELGHLTACAANFHTAPHVDRLTHLARLHIPRTLLSPQAEPGSSSSFQILATNSRGDSDLSNATVFTTDPAVVPQVCRHGDTRVHRCTGASLHRSPLHTHAFMSPFMSPCMRALVPQPVLLSLGTLPSSFHNASAIGIGSSTMKVKWPNP